MIVTEADTQMFLPSFDLPATGKYRMEIVLEAHPAPPPVLAAAVAWEKTFDQLTAALEASQAEIGRRFLHELVRLELRTHVGHATSCSGGSDGDSRELPHDGLAL